MAMFYGLPTTQMNEKWPRELSLDFEPQEMRLHFEIKPPWA
jgi:hypothetical protein